MNARLVLLPGLACDAELWRDQLSALMAWHPRVTQVHQRHDTIQAMAGALLAQEPGPLILCGASMGGMIAMEAARQAPRRVAALALLGTTASPESPDIRELRQAAIALFERGEVADVVEPNMAFAFHPDSLTRQPLRDRYLGMILRAGAHQLVRQNRAVSSRPDARVHLRQLRCPVLVLCGEQDQLTPPACSRDIHDRVAGSELRVLPRCGHMLTLEQPEAVNAALLTWLARVAAPDGGHASG